MSNMKNIDDVLEYLTKQREMNKVNVDPKLLATARRKQLAIRHRTEGIMLVDARNPYERIVPEGLCVTCQSFTTAYNSHGECKDCGTLVTADISEVKND